MKKLFAGLAIVGLVALAGCHNTSATGGPGQGTSGTFKFEAPKTATTVKHGTSEPVKITLKKDNLKEDVSLSATVDPADKGVTADVTPKTVKASDAGEITVTVKADDKAAAGEYKVRVIGKPSKGAETDSIFSVKVPEKK